MKVAIYARVSTKDQNVETQLELLRTMCERHKYEVYREYVDIAESGKKHSRPAFDIMLKDMRNYKFNAIAVYKLDRIGRSLVHLLSLFEEFQKKQVEFISATQNINTDTPEGRLFMRMLMMMAEYERELTVNRVNAGIARARKQGKKLGRPSSGINKYEVVRLRNEGMSIRKIAKQLETSIGTVQRCIEKMGAQNA